MSPTIPTRGRFYALVTSGRMECPQCGQMIEWGQARKPSPAWNPIASVITCQRCGRQYVLGLLAWPTNYLEDASKRRYKKAWRRRPRDHQGTLAQMRKVRQLAGGLIMPPASSDEQGYANWYTGEGCTCPPLPWRRECPVHGELGEHGVELNEVPEGGESPD